MTTLRWAARGLGILAFTLAAGCGDARPVPAPHVTSDGTHPKIVGGVPSPATRDAVVLLTMEDSSCSGTLLAPNLVLTALHCVADENAAGGQDGCGPIPESAFTTPAKIGVATGASAALRTPPAAHGKQVLVEPTATLCGSDIALVLLDAPIAGATASDVRRTKVTVGEGALAAGYGDDGRGRLTKGRYERAGLEVLAVGAQAYVYTTKRGKKVTATLYGGEIATGESTCYGDSGGPLFDAAGKVVGVTSRGADDVASCLDNPSVYTDVASHGALVDRALAAAGITPPPPSPPDAGPTDDGGPTVPDDGAVPAPPAPPAPPSPSPSPSAAPPSPAHDDGGPPTPAPPGDDDPGLAPSAGCSAAPPPGSTRLGLTLALPLAAMIARRRRARPLRLS